MKQLIYSFVFTVILSSGGGAESWKENPIYLESDQVIYDQKTETLTAKGNVHIRQYSDAQEGWRHIYADVVEYQMPTSFDPKNTSKIKAWGKVRFHEPSGDLWQTDSLEFKDTFAEGRIGPLFLLTKDESRLFAQESNLINANTTHFSKVSYSPCKVCVKSYCRPEEEIKPLWQIKAEKVTHDQDQQKVTYRNARLEIKGVPVVYLPYFSHPDPKVKRKSGLLFPTYGASKDLGFHVSLPVYYTIAPNRDLTLTPIITTKQGGVIVGEYRHRFYDGDARLAGSYTHSQKTLPNAPPVLNGPRSPKPDRWHMAAQTRYDLSEQCRLRTDINRASDTTYLTRYPINRQNPSFITAKNLTSTVGLEQFREDSYWGVQGLSFQTDAPKTTPLVLPLVRFHHQQDPDRWGGILSTEAHFLSLSRQMPVAGKQATQMQRLSGGVYWKRRYLAHHGHLITFQMGSRADGYYTRHYQPSASVSTHSVEKITGRLFPQASIDWRYPLIANFSTSSWIVQPMATVITSPTLQNKNIPNEDSTLFELDDTNLFFDNRFNGRLDRVDGGHRAVYGFDNEIALPNQRRVSLFLGQSRRLDHRQMVPQGMGEDRTQSDYIGRLKVRPVSWLTGRYRVGIQPKKRYPRYSELGMCLGEKKLQFDIGHVYLHKVETGQQQAISQMNWQLRTYWADKWCLSFAQIKNLKKVVGAGSLASFLLASYQDECFQLDAGIYKTSYRDRDIRPDSGVLLQLVFRNLGSFAPLTAPKYPGSMLTTF